MGNAIVRGLNLALNLVNNSNDTLSYAINTSTVNLVGELLCSRRVHKNSLNSNMFPDEHHPLCDEDDISIQRRNNSALHIKIERNSVYDVDIPFSN